MHSSTFDSKLSQNKHETERDRERERARGRRKRGIYRKREVRGHQKIRELG